jgi:uncharacterized membrane protein YhaH (DUF805 family)
MFWSGRINRATYWVCVGLIVALYLLFNLISSKHTAVSEVVLILVCVPRLHDIGKSGWWAGGVFLAEIVIAVISFATLPLKLATIPLGVFVVIVGALMIWLGAIAGDPLANRFGEPPLRGVTLTRLRKPTPT